MKVKLKDGEYLESYGSHQGFPVSIWNKLNNGETVIVDKIPDRCANRIKVVPSSPNVKQIKSPSTLSSNKKKKTGDK